jgi:hypothetical protein
MKPIILALCVAASALSGCAINDYPPYAAAGAGGTPIWTPHWVYPQDIDNGHF